MHRKWITCKELHLPGMYVCVTLPDLIGNAYLKLIEASPEGPRTDGALVNCPGNHSTRFYGPLPKLTD